MKRYLPKLLIVFGLAAAAMVACLGPLWWTQVSYRRFLLKRVDHRAVSLACLDLLTKPEYQSLMGESPSGSDPRLPAAIREVRAFWLSVETNEITIMKIGGVYHMGYIFRPSASDSNQYDLLFQEEDKDGSDLAYPKPLYSVRRN